MENFINIIIIILCSSSTNKSGKVFPCHVPLMDIFRLIIKTEEQKKKSDEKNCESHLHLV